MNDRVGIAAGRANFLITSRRIASGRVRAGVFRALREKWLAPSGEQIAATCRTFNAIARRHAVPPSMNEVRA